MKNLDSLLFLSARLCSNTTQEEKKWKKNEILYRFIDLVLHTTIGANILIPDTFVTVRCDTNYITVYVNEKATRH